MTAGRELSPAHIAALRLLAELEPIPVRYWDLRQRRLDTTAVTHLVFRGLVVETRDRAAGVPQWALTEAGRRVARRVAP